MYQKAISLLFFLVNTSFALDTCNVLFVIDGSSYWPSFRGEMASISTTVNLLYSSSAVYANPNFWLYGDGDQDQPIPNWFYSTKQDFLNNVAEVQTNEGKETIVGATAKLNQWQIHNAVIVLYTASPENLISIAGYNYTEQYRTLAIHLNDGVDMSPISDYPSPQMSQFGNIVNLITDVCRQLPTERSSTLEPFTETASSVVTDPTTTPFETTIADTGSTVSAASTVPVATAGPCVDNDTKDCPTWVANGFCTNPAYTDDQKKQYCAKSCNLCNGCSDASASCPTWVANGFCANPAYTDDQKKQYCAKSCNLCGGSATGSTNCVDASGSCPTWVSNGFCNNPAYTNDDKKKYCAKSCNLC